MAKFTDYITHPHLKKGILAAMDIICRNPVLLRQTKELSDLFYSGMDLDEFFKIYKSRETAINGKLGKYHACYMACVFAMGFDNLLELYKDRGIGEKVLADTMQNFDTWGDAYYTEFQRAGCGDYYWLSFHMRGLLFRIGRPQFMPHLKFSNHVCVYRRNRDGHLLIVSDKGVLADQNGMQTTEGGFKTDLYQRGNTLFAHSVDKEGKISPDLTPRDITDYTLVLSDGDAVLDLHIPADGKMDFASCLASMQDIAAFAKKHFPENDYKAYTCHTWLFGPEILEFVSPKSNIARFAGLFTFAPGFDSTHSLIYQWLFGYEKYQKDHIKHTPVTSLQKGAHTLMKQGRWFSERNGFRLINTK